MTEVVSLLIVLNDHLMFITDLHRTGHFKNMPTLFESLFPLLTLQSCISTSGKSTNGPRFSASDRTTGEAFEVRAINLQPPTSSSTMSSVWLEQCRKRAEELMRNNVNNRSSESVVMFPEDVYVAEGYKAGSASPTTAPHRKVSMDKQMVSVTPLLGISLEDVASSGRSSNPSGTIVDGPTFLPEESFHQLLAVVSKYCKICLTLPTHGNLGPNALVLRYPKRSLQHNEWVVADWALDPTHVVREDRRTKTSFDKVRRIQRKWFRVLAKIFGNVTNTPAFVVGAPVAPQKPQIQVLQRNGSILSTVDIHRYLMQSLSSTPSSLGPLGGVSSSVQDRAFEEAAPLESDDDSICSLEEAALEHTKRLAEERLKVIEACRHVPTQIQQVPKQQEFAQETSVAASELPSQIQPVKKHIDVFLNLPVRTATPRKDIPDVVVIAPEQIKHVGPSTHMTTTAAHTPPRLPPVVKKVAPPRPSTERESRSPSRIVQSSPGQAFIPTVRTVALPPSGSPRNDPHASAPPRVPVPLANKQQTSCCAAM